MKKILLALLLSSTAAYADTVLPPATVGQYYEAPAICAGVTGNAPAELVCLNSTKYTGTFMTAGTYNFSSIVREGFAYQVIPYQLTVQAAAVTQAASVASTAYMPTTGHWFTPGQGGTGWTLEASPQGNPNILVFNYAFAADGRPDWIYSNLSQVSTNFYTGQAWHCNGGQVVASPDYMAPTCGAYGGQQVTITLQLLSSTSAVIAVNGVSQKIQPYQF